MKEYWVSAHTDYGDLFWATIEAVDDDDMFRKFREEYPHCDIADYGCGEGVDSPDYVIGR